jgi:squalene-hopene/tetraprenyl-beta-curcumene cyclase
MSPERLQAALRKARAALLAQRTAEGFWIGELSPSALSTATAVSALCLAGDASDRDLIRAGLQWLARTQLSDGSWGDTPDSPGNLSTTLLALCAWRIAAAHRPYLRRAHSDELCPRRKRQVGGRTCLAL